MITEREEDIKGLVMEASGAITDFMHTEDEKRISGSTRLSQKKKDVVLRDRLLKDNVRTPRTATVPLSCPSPAPLLPFRSRIRY